MTYSRSFRAGVAAVVVAAASAAIAVFPGGSPVRVARAATAGPAGQLQIDELSLTSPITRSSFEVSATNPLGGGGGGGTGETTFDPLVVQRNVDEHSPALMQALARGLHVGKAVVRVYRPGTTRALVTYELGDVVLTLVSQTGKTERLALAYRTIEMTSGGSSACYDLSANNVC